MGAAIRFASLFSRHAAVGLLALVFAPASRAAELWQPVSPADLALKTPSVDKDADAEALLWEVWVVDDSVKGKLEFENYLRIKIFTEHGRDAHSTIDLPIEGKSTITEITGRTIKPDGSIIPLGTDAVFERTLVKAGGFKIRAMSFAMPAVEPGAIIEYRWREHMQFLHTNYIPLPFQRDIPVQLVRYHIKPVGRDPDLYLFQVQPFHCGSVDPVLESKGHYLLELKNVPAFASEPDMPPESEVRAWMVAYWKPMYLPGGFWTAYGQRLYEIYKPYLKTNGDVRSTAQSIIAGAATPEDKLHRLFDYCRTNIKNLRGESVTAEERADASRNKHPADTLRQRAGTGFDINMAFAALATAAGFDARPASLGDRSRGFFHPKDNVPILLSAENIAVKLDGQWRFFDPSSTYVSYGMLRWQEEGEAALVSDAHEPVFIKTPLSPPEKSLRKRVGHFVLSPDGALEGDVRLEFTGHDAVRRKQKLEGEQPAQQVDRLHESFQQRLPGASITGIEVANAGDLEKPLVYRYHVKVPGYAERTGKRLFLRPAFFQFNTPARFVESARKYPVYFEYPWTEDDEVVIQMPAGFELDHAEQAPTLEFGKPGRYQTNIGVSKGREIVYTRKFTFGADANILYPATGYAKVKHAFDAIHEADDHIVTLKQEAAAK